jgi:hypothetical protein
MIIVYGLFVLKQRESARVHHPTSDSRRAVEHETPGGGSGLNVETLDVKTLNDSHRAFCPAQIKTKSKSKKEEKYNASKTIHDHVKFVRNVFLPGSGCVSFPAAKPGPTGTRL